MFHINNDKTGKPYVILVAENHEILSVTESFEQKASAWVNMLAQLRAFNDFKLFVQDNVAEDKVIVSFKDIDNREKISADGVSEIKPLIHMWLSDSKEPKPYVTVIGGNNEILSTTELFSRKHAAWKNIDAQRRQLGGIMVPVQDNTGETPVLYYLHETGEHATHPGKTFKQPNYNR
jgi:uncharacterized protein YegP (UPF0339 family)